MLSKSELNHLNHRMLSLGAPFEKDDLGYNRPDYCKCERILSCVDDMDAYLLCSILLKYKNRQLEEYKEDLEKTYEFYKKKAKKNRNLSKKRTKKDKLIDLHIKDNLAYIYISFVPYELYKIGIRHSNANSKLVEANTNDLFCLLKILSLNGFIIRGNIWKEVKKLESNPSEVFQNIFIKSVREYRNRKKITKDSNSLIKDNTFFIKVFDEEDYSIKLEYPRENNDIILNMLKNLPSSFREYYTNSYGLADYSIKYAGISLFIKSIDEYNKSDYLMKINYDDLLQYLDKPMPSTKIDVSEDLNDNKYYLIKFQYNQILVNKIKELDSRTRRWDGENRCWKVEKYCLKNLYDLYKDMKIDNAPLDLSDFEKLIDFEAENIVKIIPRYRRGYRNLAEYELVIHPFDENVVRIVERCGKREYGKLYVSLSNFEELINTIKGLDIKIDYEELSNILQEEKDKFYNKDFPMIDVNTLNRKPLSHQLEGIEKMLSMKRFILGDEMGLGKTYESIVWGLSLPYKKIVVCPKVLKLNWEKEIKAVDPSQEVVIIDGNKYKSLTTSTGWLIINYDILNKHIDDILEEDFQIACIDEAHYIKSVTSGGKPSSIRSKATLRLLETTPFKALITGTPITNKTKDIWNILGAIEHPLANNFYRFADTYCDAISTEYGYIFDGASNTEELHSKLKPYMVRRLKNEVLDLPEKTRIFIPTKINVKEYKKLLKEYMKERSNLSDVGQHLVYLNALRVILADEKISSTIEFAKDIVDQGEPIVIFTNYTNPSKEFKKFFGDDAVIVTGETSEKNRLLAVEQFQSGKAKVFIGNLKAAGVGITLTRARTMIFNDYDWLPANHIQGEDRLHRISQENKCNIYYNYACNADIDCILTESLDKKLKSIGSIIDGKEDEFITKSMVNDLIEIL